MSRLRHNAFLFWLALVGALAFTAGTWADHLELKNGSSWLEGRGDASGNLMVGGIQNVTMLASAARTTGANGPDQTNTTYRGVIIYLNVTAASGTGGLTVAIDFKDPLSGQYRQTFAAAAVVTAVTSSPKIYVAYPGSITANTNDGVMSGPLAATWRVRIAVGDNSSYTYSVSADLLI